MKQGCKEQNGYTGVVIIKIDWINMETLEVEIWIYVTQYSRKEEIADRWMWIIKTK